MKAKGNNAFCRLAVFTALFASLALAGPSYGAAPTAGAMENYCAVPPFIGTAASPLVLLMMQKDEKLWQPAYDDLSDVDGDGLPDYTYKHLTWEGMYNEYKGYFDSYKCYTYSAASGWFEPVSFVDSEYYCSGAWNGNFLNWATMTRIDIIRKVFFGGTRFKDDPPGTPAAVLERAFLPPDGHSFLKIYACDAGSTDCDISRLTPYDTHPKDPNKKVGKLSLCNTTLGGYGDTFPPLMRAASGDDNVEHRYGGIPGWERWASNETWQCALQGEKKKSDGTPIGDDALRPGADDHLGDFRVRMVACDPTYITGSPDVKSTERCRLYEQHGNYMPIGMVQKYGEDSSMYFGLMTGSYDRNKSGGVLRAELSDFGDDNSSDVNRTTGKFTANSGFWPTLKSITIANYDYTTGTYKPLDNCPPAGMSMVPFSGFSEGQCSNWGNPLAEMYYEGLRYFVGKDIATAEFEGSDSNVIKPAINPPTKTWNSQLDPYSKTNVEPCAEAFALVISDPYPSYDGDQLPGSALGAGITSDLPESLPGLNVAELAFDIGENEGIHGNQWLVGYIEGGTPEQQDNMCSLKTVTDLGRVKGICPLEPGREGSYYLPALALYGQRTDLRPGFTNTTDGFGQTGNQNLTTYAVALKGMNAEIEKEGGSVPVKVMPACFNRDTGKPCTLTELRFWDKYENEPALEGERYYFSWDVSPQGGDYDMDVDGQLFILKYKQEPWKLHIRMVVGNKSDDMTDRVDIGFAVSGTDKDGLQLPIKVNDPEGCNKDEFMSHYWMAVINNIPNPCYTKGGGMYYSQTDTTQKVPKSPLWLAAKYGGFKDANENGMPDQTTEWDGDGNGIPDTYLEADTDSLEPALEEAFRNILSRVTSGTAASVLASGEGSGANIVQAVYYPRKRFLNGELSWLGSLHNYWYYVDPFFNLSSIREDTPAPPALYGDKTLNLTTDNIVHMYFDEETLNTKVDLYKDSDGNGAPDYKVGTKDFGEVAAIWKAGLKLWARDVTTDPRDVYTVDEMGTMIKFSVANAAALAPLMNVEDRDLDGSNIPETEDIIRYVLGEHVTVDRDGDGAFDYLLRSRVAGIDLNNDGDINDTVSVDLFGDGSQALSETNVWKLGDIVDSTPKIASFLEVNDYDQARGIAYNDSSYRDFIGTEAYRARGTVYVGANDGMLHAFKLGKHPKDAEGNMDTMRLTGANLGREEWAFIPRNALPYLKFLAEEDYCHVNTIDLSPYLVDASVVIVDPVTVKQPDGTTKTLSQAGECAWGIENCYKDADSWRTILIGGMRFGGACDPKGTKNAEGVESPASTVDLPNHGLSSYFALDVTGGTPKFLWEFSDPNLGFSTSGPAIVRINGAKDMDGDSFPESPDEYGEERMGRWFAVFGSGPTGYIDTRNHQFMAHSYKDLRLFVVDLWEGTLDGNIIEPKPPIPQAFAGSMLRATVDADKDYSDDVLYVGYTKYDGTDNAWTNGGVGRLITNEDVNPKNWVWSKLIDDIGPVTSGPTKIFDEGYGKMWVYAATGRYFYKLPKDLDDEQNRRTLLGMIDPCIGLDLSGYFTADPKCTDTDSTNDYTIDGNNIDAALADATTNTDLKPDVVRETKRGWYISLQQFQEGTGFGAERVVTDVEHSLEGYVFYTSFKPYSGACVLGGRSYLWVVNYDNGGAPGAGLKGKALVQVSTGAIEEIDLKDALDFGESLSYDEIQAGKTETHGRRTASMEGVPPVAQGLSLMTAPAASRKIIHFRER